MTSTVKGTWDHILLRLELLDAERLVVLATFSASRSARFCSRYWKEKELSRPDALMNLLSSAWEAISDNRYILDLRDVGTALRLQAEMLDQDDLLATAAQEACFAGLVMVEILSGIGGPSQTMRVISFTRDIVDMLAQEDLKVDGAQLEQAVLTHPLMVEELSKHRAVIDLLEKSSLEPSVVRKVRAYI
jgi:hypothetical protein